VKRHLLNRFDEAEDEIDADLLNMNEEQYVYVLDFMGYLKSVTSR
jgi:hypothetical protein